MYRTTDDPNATPEYRILKDYDGSIRVVWHEQVCSPAFNSKGAAQAYVDMLRRGQRKPEVSYHPFVATPRGGKCSSCGERRSHRVHTKPEDNS